MHCDGSAVPNPGRMACGVVLLAPDGSRHTVSRAIPTVGCNNEAELWAITVALAELRRLGATSAVLHSDNSTVVAQLAAPEAGRPAPILRLEPAFEAARRLMAEFGEARLQWVPRHRNGQADALARAAQGLPEKPVLPPGRKRLSKARRKNG
ncbi:ribonuclease HI family protein [Xylophilus rhododendri]|uniref:ribonuclease HI family protein n=1 Tax=Xylophilus rhododendri TaxID=2697032 RepID=UPI00389A5255